MRLLRVQGHLGPVPRDSGRRQTQYLMLEDDGGTVKDSYEANGRLLGSMLKQLEACCALLETTGERAMLITLVAKAHRTQTQGSSWSNSHWSNGREVVVRGRVGRPRRTHESADLAHLCRRFRMQRRAMIAPLTRSHFATLTCRSTQARDL